MWYLLEVSSIPFTHQQSIKHRTIVACSTTRTSCNIHLNYQPCHNLFTLIQTFFATHSQSMQAFHQKVIDFIPVLVSKENPNTYHSKDQNPFQYLTYNIYKPMLFFIRCGKYSWRRCWACGVSRFGCCWFCSHRWWNWTCIRRQCW